MRTRWSQPSPCHLPTHKHSTQPSHVSTVLATDTSSTAGAVIEFIFNPLNDTMRAGLFSSLFSRRQWKQTSLLSDLPAARMQAGQPEPLGCCFQGTTAIPTLHKGNQGSGRLSHSSEATQATKIELGFVCPQGQSGTTTTI